MVSSSREPGQDGFATQAATLVCLVVSLMLVAVLMAGTEALKQADEQLARSRIEYGLDGVQLLAELKIMAATRPGRFQWSEAASGGETAVRAEPEVAKLEIKSTTDLDHQLLMDLGVADPAQLRARLLVLSQQRAVSIDDLRQADPSILWSQCIHDFASPFGRADKLDGAERQTPEPGQPTSRQGQAWRIETTDPSGWTDDRTVIFTGDDRRPAAVLERRFYHQKPEGSGCDALIAKYAKH